MSAAAGPAPPLLEYWQGRVFGSPASTTAAAAAAAGTASTPMLSSTSIHAAASAAYGCSGVPSLLPGSSLTAARCGSLQRCCSSSNSHSLACLASEGNLPAHGNPFLPAQTSGHGYWTAPNGLQPAGCGDPTTLGLLPGAAALPHALLANSIAAPPTQLPAASLSIPPAARAAAAALAAAPAGPDDLGPAGAEASRPSQAAPLSAQPHPHQHQRGPTRMHHQSYALFSSSSCSTSASTSTSTPTPYHTTATQPHRGPIEAWAEQPAGGQGSPGSRGAEAAYPGVGGTQAPCHQRGMMCRGGPSCSACGGEGRKGHTWTGSIRAAAASGIACNGGGSNGVDGWNAAVTTTSIAAAARSSMSCSSSFNDLVADGAWRAQEEGEGEAMTGVRGQQVLRQHRHHANHHKRQPHAVRPSQITSQLRTRAATRIQAAWRAYRVRRLYLRLQRRLAGAGAEPQEDSYCGVREFPPIPDEPAISLFTLYGRPSLMRGLQRRVWFDMSRHPDPRMRHPQPPPPPHAAAPQPCPAAAALPGPPPPPRPARTSGAVARTRSSTSSPAAAAAATTPTAASPDVPTPTRPPSARGSPALTPSTHAAKDHASQQKQQKQYQQRSGQQQPLASPFTASSQCRPQPSPSPSHDLHSLPHHPPTPQPHPHAPAPVPAPATATSAAPPALPRPAFRGPLRIRVPATQADVPMSEVERILAGGFWKDEPPPDADAGAGAGGGSEPLSLYMRAKMRQEEREAEEALQMLSYEPHDLRHVLGSLKERTLEKLGSLGRTLGALRGPTHGSGPQAGVDEGEPSALWATHGSAVDVDGHAGVAGGPGPGAGAGGWGQQAAGASGSGALGAAGSGQGGGGHVAVGAVLARSLTRAAASAADWWQHLALRAAAAAGSLPTSQHDPHRRGSAAGRRLYRLSSAGNGGWLPLRGSVSGGDQAAAPAAAALAWGGIAAMGSGELHVPLLTVVDETGAASTMPQGAVPIAINWQRYRSRSHVSRMSL